MCNVLSVEEPTVEVVAAAAAGTTGSDKCTVAVVVTAEHTAAVGNAKTAAPVAVEVDRSCNWEFEVETVELDQTVRTVFAELSTGSLASVEFAVTTVKFGFEYSQRDSCFELEENLYIVVLVEVIVMAVIRMGSHLKIVFEVAAWS